MKDNTTEIFVGTEYVDELWDFIEYEKGMTSVIHDVEVFEGVTRIVIDEYLYEEEVEDFVIQLMSMGERGFLMAVNQDGRISMHNEEWFGEKYNIEVFSSF